MRGEPFTACNISPYSYPVELDPQPQEGAFLIAASGRSAYRIERVHELPQQSPDTRRYKLRCTRWPVDQVPDDAMRFDIVWDRRDRRTA